MKVVGGSDSVDIERVADNLKTRARELKGLYIPEPGELPQFEFVPNDDDTSIINQVNIVGKLSSECISFENLSTLAYDTRRV